MSNWNEMCERLRELRKRMGLTQEELAERVGVHLNTISRWENGIDIPKTFKLKRLAEALCVTESELLNGPVTENWELRLVMRRAGDPQKGVIDMTQGTNAALYMEETTMAISLSASYELWSDDEKFEALIEELRRKRATGLRTRREDW